MMDLAAVVLTSFAAAPLAPLVCRWRRRLGARLLAVVPFILFALFCLWIDTVGEGHTLVSRRPWIPGLDMHLVFLLDGLSLLMALLVTGIGGFVFLYAADYLRGDPHVGRFYAYLLLFMGSMLGLVLAGNLILLYVFWELTTVSSFLLIGFHHDEKASRQAAVQALVVTNIGGLAMLSGFILLAQAGGGYDLPALLIDGRAIRGHRWYPAIVLLLLSGAFTKSAQVPFHFWLPNAMHAPTPVSAYLHSATMVKGGVYLIARLHPVFGGDPLWAALLMVFGGASLLVGGGMALGQRDGKRMLAYSTISVLGLLILLLGIGSREAIEAAVVYLFAHALYKATLFLGFGAVEQATGSRDITRLGGLGRFMPLVAAGGIAAALSKSGLPPAIGYIGKELAFASGWHAHGHPLLLSAVLVAGSMLLATVGWITGIAPFVGAPDPQATRHPVAWGLRLAPLVLGLAGLAAGMAPGVVGEALLQPAVAAVRQRPTTLDLALWHGLKPSLALSAAAIAGGLVIFFNRRRIRRLGDRVGGAARFGPERVSAAISAGIAGGARMQCRILERGYLRHYLMVVYGFTALLVLMRWFEQGAARFQPVEVSVVNGLALGLCGLMIGSAVVVIRSPTLPVAVIALGVIGYCQALFFMLYSAPDVALTQILVETVTLVLFILIVYRLPPMKRVSGPLTRVGDAVAALATGTAMALLILETGFGGTYGRISAYFADQSVPAAHAHNVVTAILVDFRSLDTLGEMTVLTTMALGVLTLMRAKS